MSEGSRHAHLFSFSADKAGMSCSAADKSRQAQVIYDMSKGSAFFRQAAAQDAKIDEKVAAMKARLDGARDWELQAARGRADAELAALEGRRNLTRVRCVLDMDMFFAAVEIRDSPHLRELPVAVGDASMICTANYVARTFGVRAAMPGFIAKKLCPSLVFVPLNFDKYTLVAQQIRKVIGEYDPDFRSHSLDEVYFDLTDAVGSRVHEDAALSDDARLASRERAAQEVVSEIRARIAEATGGLTSSAGIASNFMLAKIGADRNKPEGQFYLPPTRSAIMDFVTQLPCRKVPGIGKVLEKVLLSLELRCMGDVRAALHRLFYVCTPATRQFLLHACIGVEEGEGSSSLVEVPKGAVTRKSLGVSRTFASESSADALRERLRDVCASVARDLAEEGLSGRVVTLKLKTSSFESVTKCATAAQYVQSFEAIYPLALSLLQPLLPLTLRLLGVTVSRFRNAFDPSALSGNQQLLTGLLMSPGKDRGDPRDDVVDVDAEDCLAGGVTQQFTCPVCNCCLDSNSEFVANSHVNACLNGLESGGRNTVAGAKHRPENSASQGIRKFLRIEPRK